MPNSAPSVSQKNPIAYFCSEYGISSQLPLYAGGLGVLAGDTIKQAAEQDFPLVAVGLLYHGFGIMQEISPEGMQIDTDMPFDPLAAGLEHVYHDDEHPVFVKVHMTEVDVWLRVWKKTFANNLTLYLLDSDTDQNALSERSITKLLYSGTDQSQLKQQFLLGIGGVKLLRDLHIHPSLYHVNEGRPAFLHWQLIRELMKTQGIDYYSAHKLAKEVTVYTNHTLVGAGNKSYPKDMVIQYGKYYADKIGVSVDELLMPGLNDDGESFSVTKFALNTSKRANGVSELHTSLSQQVWPEYHWANITNGVHLSTWQDPKIAQAKTPEQLWTAHQENKWGLEAYVKEKTGYGYDPNRLTIGWARRMAGYKQLPVLFEDIDRLKAILTRQDQPVQLLISGKAHQGDASGKAMLQEIIKYMQTELSGYALFIPNYNIEIAQMLTRGVDVWLNTPQIGKEACGTSGMKAVSNGVLSISTNDGWVPEVDWTRRGWILDADHLSASTYSLLENTVVPLYYERNDSGLPSAWIQRMQASVEIAKDYSAERMLREYQEKLYI